MGPLLALASAVCYGIVDFTGGILSRRAPYTAVTFLGRLGGRAEPLWGALSGVGSGIAMTFLNRGLSRGAMSVVVPVSAVTGVALSVLCGVLALGDRPDTWAWVGSGVTVPALWLVSGGSADGTRGAGDGLPAGAGVAVQYVALGLARPGAGLWPVAVGRVAAVLLLPTALRLRPPRPPSRLTARRRSSGP
ncbi:EamA family transporter [Streptomyces sp. NPDC001617]